MLPSKDVISDKNVSTREKRISYKPSNRYFDEKSTFLNNHWLEETSKSFYDFYLQKINNSKIYRKLKYKRTFENINTINCKVDTDDMENKILRLMGPSPRSLYVRQNVKILKTHYKSMEKECRIINKITTDVSLRTRNNISKNNALTENSKKYKNRIENTEYIFDIITSDGKKFKLNPMRLDDPDWMLSCLENYIGMKK